MSVTLEAGKFYRTRDGRKVGPMRKDPHGFTGPCDRMIVSYTPLGKFGQASGDMPSHMREAGDFGLDIIAEWTDAPTGPVRTVTRKEIVPGEYAHALHISAGRVGEVGVSFGGYHFRHLTAEQLRETIATLTEIADALEAPTQ